MTMAITSSGAVSGEQIDGVTRFLGIPYAASPTGSRRFAAPEPPEPWDGVRECIAFSATPPKPEYAAPFDTILPEPSIPGDDWLSLNVWTRDLTGAAPVMVWIHGGAFANGNSAVPMYDGHAFARDGVVLVTINYRLGVDGFALLPDAPAPANRGLLDQVAALEWVRDNIAAFGGDPANVTIFGESAGGMSVATLLGMPRAQGLFRQVIAQSGAAQAGADPRDAALVTAELGTALGFEATAASLADLDLDKLIQAQATVRDAMAASPNAARFGPTVVATSMAFLPVIDGDVLPLHPLAALKAGVGSDVALMTGTNTEEFRLFFVPTGTADMVTDETLPGFLAALGIPADTARRLPGEPAGRHRRRRPLRAGDRPLLPESGVRRRRGTGGRGRASPDVPVRVRLAKPGHEYRRRPRRGDPVRVRQPHCCGRGGGDRDRAVSRACGRDACGMDQVRRHRRSGLAALRWQLPGDDLRGYTR